MYRKVKILQGKKIGYQVLYGVITQIIPTSNIKVSIIWGQTPYNTYPIFRGRYYLGSRRCVFCGVKEVGILWDQAVRHFVGSIGYVFGGFR